MKRKILEITEIDCGDETCGKCRHKSVDGLWCDRFGEAIRRLWEDPAKRLPECLEAERLLKLADDAVALQNIRAGNFTVVGGD